MLMGGLVAGSLMSQKTQGSNSSSTTYSRVTFTSSMTSVSFSVKWTLQRSLFSGIVVSTKQQPILSPVLPAAAQGREQTPCPVMALFSVSDAAGLALPGCTLWGHIFASVTPNSKIWSVCIETACYWLQETPACLSALPRICLSSNEGQRLRVLAFER